MGQTATAEGRDEEELKWQFYDLDFSIQRSRRYHEKLAAFFASWRNRFRIVTVLAGSGAFFAVVGKYQHAAELITAFIGLWAILDIIFMPDKQHDLHNELSRSFTALAAKLQQMPQTPATLRELTAERLLLEQKEPPCKRLVDLEARNDELRARDFPVEALAPLSRPQRVWGYYGATWGLAHLEEWKAQQQRNSK